MALIRPMRAGMIKSHVLRANVDPPSCAQSIPPGPNGQIWPGRAGGGACNYIGGASYLKSRKSTLGWYLTGAVGRWPRDGGRL